MLADKLGNRLKILQIDKMDSFTYKDDNRISLSIARLTNGTSFRDIKLNKN